MAELVEHLERYLGPIQEGWSIDADGLKLPFQVVRFDQGSGSGTISFSTLGLSRHALPSPASRQLIRHELLLLAPDSLRAGPIPSLLQQVALETLASGRALLRGDVLGPRGPLVPGSSMEAFYVGMPVYFPDEFATCEVEGESVVIAWLIPISRSEAAFVTEHGWPAFEERLVATDPDLTDVDRPSLGF